MKNSTSHLIKALSIWAVLGVSTLAALKTKRLKPKRLSATTPNTIKVTLDFDSQRSTVSSNNVALAGPDPAIRLRVDQGDTLEFDSDEPSFRVTISPEDHEDTQRVVTPKGPKKNLFKGNDGQDFQADSNGTHHI